MTRLSRHSQHKSAAGALSRSWGVAFGDRTVMHLDMDAFFAQIEVLDNPEYAGKPLVVGGLRDSKRGVVSTCTYEARRYGIHSAMPIARAVQLCPHAIFVSTRMDRYEDVAKQIRKVLASFAPAVEPLSIDEAFLDMTGCEHFYTDPEHMGSELKRQVFEITGLTSSVGIAPNKFLAKLASDRNKPDGLFILPTAHVDKFLLGLPVTSLWGVGPKTADRLHRHKIRTVADVRRQDVATLTGALGERLAQHLYALAYGKDNRPVESVTEAKSIGRETTFTTDIPDGPKLRSHLAKLVADVAWRVRQAGVYARTITVKVRLPNFETHTKSRTLDRAINDDDTLFAEANKLLDAFRLREPLRLLGVTASHFQEQTQASLFDEPTDRLTTVIDGLNTRLGSRAVRRGREL